MALPTPLLRGPLNEWTQEFVVEGAMPEAMILVIDGGGRPLGKLDHARGGLDRVPCDPAVHLSRGDSVLLTQHLHGQSSLPTPPQHGQVVGPAPSRHKDLPALSVRTSLYDCGACLWATGAQPGAVVRVEGPSGSLAQGRVNERGNVKLVLTAGTYFVASQLIRVWQEAPSGRPALSGTAKVTSVMVEDHPVSSGEAMPPPILAKVLKGCDGAVHLEGVVDGATVTITRADGSTESAVFGFHRIQFNLLTPVPAAGERLVIVQSMEGCGERLPSEGLLVNAGPATRPGAPSLKPPCLAATAVEATGLEPHAVATLIHGDQIYPAFMGESTEFTFLVPPLDAGDLSLYVEKCALRSDTTTISMPPTEGAFTTPELIPPLFGCANAVRVAAQPGTFVQVWADRGDGPGPISDHVYASATQQIPVSPHLNTGQRVWLKYLPCGQSSWTSVSEQTVEESPEAGAVQITAAIDGDRYVVVDAIPGARVEVFSYSPGRLTTLIGSGIVDPHQMWVGLLRPLNTHELVHARQILCGRTPERQGAVRTPIPRERSFALPAPITRPSNQPKMNPLICLWAKLECSHDGAWTLSAEFENQEEDADCSFDLQVDLQDLPTPFGAVLSGSLSAAGHGEVTKTGLRTRGIPPRKAFTTPITMFAGFQDPHYWTALYDGAIPKFALLPVAWQDYKGWPGEPDYEEKDEGSRG